jgi:hypothetical protein
LMPIAPSREFLRLVGLKPEYVPFPNGQPSCHKRPSRALARFLITFCTGGAAISLWVSYGDAARETISHSYPQLGWLAPPPAPTAQNPRSPDITARATPAVHPTEQLATSFDLDAVQQTVGEIATTTATGQGQMAGSGDQTVTSIATDQEQMTRSIDETVTRIAQLLSGKATGITVESRADAASLPPTARLDVKPTEAKPPQTFSERKQLSAASGHDASCFQSAPAVLKHHPGGRPTWTLRAPGHEGTICWYAAARPRGSDHRKEKEIVGTTANGLSPASVPHPPQWWNGGLP